MFDDHYCNVCHWDPCWLLSTRYQIFLYTDINKLCIKGTKAPLVESPGTSLRMTLFSRFCSSTSLHGFPHLLNTSVPGKSFWVFVIFAMLSVAGLLCGKYVIHVNNKHINNKAALLTVSTKLITLLISNLPPKKNYSSQALTARARKLELLQKIPHTGDKASLDRCG